MNIDKTPLNTIAMQMNTIMNGIISNRERAVEADYDNEREPTDHDDYLEMVAGLETHGD